ncbi:hypothetical protein GH714_021810 [Hevea brasiliensis]|uniref:Uncharacterized protein n=1 Tax=Hevea brasiliensis TaxID=3981 RepID=A0A6A6NIE2_HEVBR|nr:hypothetical protein GH714_021810 [Hevea brasiliensis]
MPLEERDNLERDLQSSKDDVEGLANGGGDDSSSTCDISEIVQKRIEQLESEGINKRAQKKLRSTMKPLELVEELEKKLASTGLHWKEGAAGQPMKLMVVRKWSTALGYFDIDASNAITRTIASQAFRRDHGSPQVLAVHLNYIAVGMAKGVIVVVPNSNTWFAWDRSHAPVTSMCFNQQGDLLLAGYGDGHITVWDVQRASGAKVITGEHMAPVVHAFFLGQDSQVTRQFKAVIGDSKGTVLSASPLLFDDSISGALPSSQGNASLSSCSIGNMMGGVVGADAGWKLFNEGSSMVEEGVVIFVTHQTALVVRLIPTLEVYAQLSRPDGLQEGSMPYTPWKYVAERVSLLAVAWDRKVQVAKLVKSELKVFGTWSLDSSAIGVDWLDAHMLVVLTLAGQLYLLAKDGTVIHRTSFAVDGSGGDDLVAYHTHFINIYGNPEKAYHNSLARAGDWMGALNMAMTLYDGQAYGVIDLPKSVDAVQEIITPYLVELLLSFADEVFSYISVAFCNQIGKGELDEQKSGSHYVHSEIKEQFTHVGGVAVEFCVHIWRTDILFDEIFSKFVAVQHRGTLAAPTEIHAYLCTADMRLNFN